MKRIRSELLFAAGFTMFCFLFAATTAPAAMFPSRLDDITKSKLLRVGTTGDYPPFSSVNAGGQYSGIDVELATTLAQSLGAKVEFVKTTWGTLAADLDANKFDIAVGGITRTLQRQQVGLFSDPYLSGGKTAIARCADAEKFNTLEKIDQSGVTVVENPGGTNEQFAKSRLKKAKIFLAPDNASVFDLIASGKGDVMFTDDVEVRYRTGLHKDLCATMPGKTLDKSVKAYFLPRDPVFLEYVNSWLAEIKLKGALGAIFTKYLGGGD